MQANELRVGNWISVGGSTIDTYQSYTPYKVTADAIKAIQAENEERPDAMLSVWQPITLTSDLLEKNCGFVKYDGTIQCWNRPDTDFDLLKNRAGDYYACKTGMESIDHIYGQAIHNLHQLQNLYFILTGKELQVSLT